jgi:DNA-binding response OmpR family regulator
MRKKILIVEDNTELLVLTRLNLKAAGFSVVTATNGLQGIKKARSMTPDLILLDLGLPELDGFAVCEILRNDKATAATPILILTGMASELTRLVGLESGANDYLSKPIDPKSLIGKIKELLQLLPKPAEN